MFGCFARLKDSKLSIKNMNKEKVKILNEALEKDNFLEDCNDPEVLALLKAGGKIKESILKTEAPDPNFRNRLKAEILARRRSNAFSMKDKISQTWNDFRSRLAMKRLAPAVAAIVLVALVFTAVKFWPGGGFSPLSIDTAYAKDNFTVETTSGGDLGIQPDTQFIIKSKTAIRNTDSLRSNIKLLPDTDFDLVSISDHEFRLTPKSKLSDKQVYRLVISSNYINENGLTVDRDYSWAFQVKDSFKVIGSTPADKTSAPANTGIEITLSTENFSGFEDAFSISPAVPGRFEKHGRTMVFIPNKPLAKDTLYTVNIAPTITNTITSEKLSEAYHFQFEVSDNNYMPKSLVFIDGEKAEFSSNQNPAFAVYASNRNDNEKISTKVYNYRSVEDFVAGLRKYYEIPDWARGARSNFKADTSSLSLASSYELPISSNNKGDFIVLPNALPVGFYLIEAGLGDSHSFIFVQISDVSAYTSVTDNKILFWINDIASLQGASAKVTDLGTGESANSDNNGVAAFNTDKRSSSLSFFLVESAGKKLVVSLPLNSSPAYKFGYFGASSAYWSYLYADRTLYKPTDTINFWGFAKSRAANNEMTDKELTVRLVSDRFFDFYNQPEIIVSQKIKTDNRGFFIGSLKLNNLGSGSYRLKVQSGDQDIYSGQYIYVEEYIKPAYKLDITPSAPAVFSGSKINYEIKASFFEGTPLVNKELSSRHFSEDGGAADKKVVTDNKGAANLSYNAICRFRADSGSESCYDSLDVKATLAEQAQIAAYSSVIVFNARMHFDSSKVERVDNSNRVRVSTKLYNIDLDKADNNWNGLPAANKQVTAEISTVEYVPRQTGTYYDFINKVSYPVYEYDRKTNALPSKSFVTGQDGSGILELDVNPKYSYEIRLVTRDQLNNPVANTVYFNAINDGMSSDYNYYNLSEAAFHEKGYQLGEKVDLKVKRNGQEMTDVKGRFLFLRLKGGLVDYSLKNEAAYDFTYSEEDIPNIWVAGTWFDGKTYYDISSFNAYFNREERRLSVSIIPDKGKYQPGEEASLRVEVKDKDGRGVKANVNISAVDAALAALGGISPALPLESLYQNVSSGLIMTQYSHKNRMSGGGGAEGGGGDGNGRSNFPDLALFTQVETGNDGKASLKFALPDSVTSWQISAQAIAGNALQAGATTTELKASLPFFVDVNFSEQYVKGDEPVLKATVYGEALKASDKAQAYLDAPALNINNSTQEVSAFVPAYFNLSKLAGGNYELKIGARQAGNQDAVIRNILVIDSRLSQRVQVISEIKGGQAIAGSDKNWTTISLMDNNRGRYFSELLNLSYNNGARVDQKMSSVVASSLLNDYFGAQINISDLDLKVYQADDGGISLLPYSSADLRVSALSAMLSADSFDRAALAGYFYKIYGSKDSDREEMALALSGLASLDEPVLISLREFNQAPGLKPMDRLYLALGAKSLGDDNLAQNIYNSLLEEYGEELDSYIRLKIDGNNNDNNSLATALAAILASGWDEQRAEKLWNYAQDNQAADYLTSLERLLYLRHAVPSIPAGDSKFTLKVGNEEINKELKRGENYLFKVSPDQLQSLQISVNAGNIIAVSDYEGSADMGKKDNSISISKSYLVNGKEADTFKETDIIEVRIKPQFQASAIEGAYEISDVLPSGLKLSTDTYRPDKETMCGIWYPYASEGQKVRFILDKNWNKTGKCRPQYISYFVRVSQPGKYIVEPALIQSAQSPAVKNFSGSREINITK